MHSEAMEQLDRRIAELEDIAERFNAVRDLLSDLDPKIVVSHYRRSTPGNIHGRPEDCEPPQPEEVDYTLHLPADRLPDEADVLELISLVLGDDWFDDAALEQARAEVRDFDEP